MKNNAIYPGTFDPITYGHIDVIRKALKVVDTVIIAISDGNNKSYLFNSEERIEIIKKALFYDLKFKKNRIKIISFKSLTPRNSSSSGSVISFSISSAVLPGNIVVTKILVELISGKSSRGIVLYAVIPDIKNNTIMT